MILFQDEFLIAVEKPAGIHTAPLRPGESDTLLDRLIADFPEVAKVPGIKPVEPGLVHRLDRGTSGLVLVARTTAAFAALREQFAEGRARKEYHAACAPAAGWRAEDAPLAVESRFAPFGPGRRMVRVVRNDGEDSGLPPHATRSSYRTEAEIVARSEERALLRARIAKGFRHQVRAHLACLGYPILGDPLYGAPAPPEWPRRMYLHASRIDLLHPITGEPLVIVSPLPEEFEAMFPRAG